MILPQDSTYSENVTEVENIIKENKGGVQKIFAIDSAKKRQLQSLTAYARTDASGKFSFANLPDDKAFEVIPLQPGYQFGPSKGVQELDRNVAFSFYQAPHTIKLFSTRDFNNLKKEKALIIRTPDQLLEAFSFVFSCFIYSLAFVHHKPTSW
jgi:predicted DNA binding CopG/RHH family protein